MGISVNLTNEKLKTLVSTSVLVNSYYSDINVLLEKIVRIAMHMTEGDAASLMVLDQRKKQLRFEIALGPKGVEVKKMLIDIHKGIAGWVVRNNRSLVIDDASQDSRFDATVQDATGYHTRNIVAIPMRIKGNPVGVIEVLNKIDDKPFTDEDIVVLEIFAVQAALAYQSAHMYDRSRKEIIVLQDKLLQTSNFHTIVAKSPVMQQKIEICKKVANSNASVLILGESGVGKELIAEQLHLHSDRKNKPFIRVNCASLHEGLLESELFGHVRGAFTGAVADRKGRFQAADGGTIFLDEIGEMPLSIQAKLLRVLQHQTFEPLGSSTTIKVDVRIITATNRDIEKQVAEELFRQDLYYRLNVVPLYIPPLRQRIEDIPELANFFLEKISNEVKKDFLGFSETAIGAMLSYSWPGNVRELENAVARACVMATPPYILEEDLLLRTHGIQTNKEFETKSLSTALETFKKQYIQAVLEKHKRNRTHTAEALGIQRTYLSRLIKELKIEEN